MGAEKRGMKRDVRDRWVEALRSGRYVQGRDQLRTEHDEFCCLGVLCEVAGIPWQDDEDEGWTIDGEVGELPASVKASVGLSCAQETELIRRNDGFAGDARTPEIIAHTFAEIADYIEQAIPVDDADTPSPEPGR